VRGLLRGLVGGLLGGLMRGLMGGPKEGGQADQPGQAYHAVFVGGGWPAKAV
jgi:predicted lipid-binding transport protein (Tim44 family)